MYGNVFPIQFRMTNNLDLTVIRTDLSTKTVIGKIRTSQFPTFECNPSTGAEQFNPNNPNICSLINECLAIMSRASPWRTKITVTLAHVSRIERNHARQEAVQHKSKVVRRKIRAHDANRF